MLNIQVFALTLIPLLAGVAPNQVSIPISPLVAAMEETGLMSDFMVGKWRCSDDFFRWGVTDTKKARVTRFRGRCLMILNKDGTMKMENLFRPSEGRWKLTDQGLVLYDPKHPKRGSQLLPVRKRDENRIWVLLPFAQGANGIGLVRITDDADALKALPSKNTRRTFRRGNFGRQNQYRYSGKATRRMRPRNPAEQRTEEDKKFFGSFEEF